MKEEVHAGQALKAAVLDFPLYAVSWVVGLVVAIISDLTITTIFVTGVALGFATHSVLVGVAGFFVVYSLLRAVIYLCDSLVASAVRVANAVGHSGSVIGESVLQSATLTEQSVIKVEANDRADAQDQA